MFLALTFSEIMQDKRRQTDKETERQKKFLNFFIGKIYVLVESQTRWMFPSGPV